MKSIGMIVAVEMDAVLSRYGRAAGVETRGGFEVHRYEGEDYTLHIVSAGAGEIAAAAATELLIAAYGAELIVNFGVVGGLTEEMALARTVLVESVVHYDFDTSAWDGCEVGRYAAYPTPHIPTTPELLARAKALFPELRSVVCASADKFVAGAEAKRALHERFGAEICEMEAAGVVLTCNRALVPCLVVKTVSDGITGGAEEFSKELRRSSEICLAITDEIIRSL